jgi:hypothetical protein
MDASEFPRPLNKSERDALNYLLATDFPGVKELREQARVASVVGLLLPGDWCSVAARLLGRRSLVAGARARTSLVRRL